MRYIPMELTSTVSMPPSSLGPGFLADIADAVRAKYLNTCTQAHGYITDIRDVRVLDTRIISIPPSVSVRAAFLGRTVKPEVGNRVRATVLKHIKQGTMHTAVDGGFRVFVPGPANSRVPEGSAATVEITAVQYDRGQFNCIGSAV